jgi:translocator assembly and maintenance protein 41
MYKYGVVSVEALRRDLTRWSDLFVAGRMQKPTTTLTTTTTTAAADASLRAASEANLRAALAAALLILPDTFSTRELHETLCGLSYEGDVRTAFGAEDVGKITRVAAGSRAGLREMYADAIARFRSNPAIGLTAVEENSDGGDCDWGQDKSAAARRALLETLPRRALALAAAAAGAGAGAEAAAAAIASRASPERTRDVVRRAINAIVFRSSARQLMSGILSTSPRKSLTYALGKAVKSVASRAR